MTYHTKSTSLASVAALAVGAMLVFVPVSAQALTVDFNDSSTGSSPDKTETGIGSVGFTDESAGSYDFTVFGASSFDHANESELNSVNFDLTGGAAGSTLTIRVSETGYFGGSGSGISKLMFDINGTALGDTITAASYVDSTNTLFGTEKQIGSDFTATNNGSTSTFSWGTTEHDTFALSGPFSMTQIITISASSKNTSYDAKTISSVPLPASALLLLGGLGGLGGLSALRRRKRAA